MNKKEFLARLAELDLPKDEFRVLSGGSLLLHGLRERTNDIQIWQLVKNWQMNCRFRIIRAKMGIFILLRQMSK